MLFKLNETEMDKALEQLTDKEVKKVIKVKEPARQPQLKVETPELIEVDLHMHELVDSTAGLSNKEMLDYQLKKFREQMEAAIANHDVKKIVFIHGLGNGVLKQELRRELSTRYKKYPFQDASFQEYGYGATMVILRK
jgi:DNA-nicking Smr family endonuclease